MGELDNTFGWAATLFVLAALLADIRHDIRRLICGRSVVLIGIFCWFLLEGVKLSPVLNTYSQATYNTAILYVFLAAICFLAGYHWTNGCHVFNAMANTVRSLDDDRRLRTVVTFWRTHWIRPDRRLFGP